MTVRVRFAPSPTGALHIGGARTALFNWLFARHHKGQFLLRIEDTDRERSTKEHEQSILDGMKWLGMDWDENPIYQSERTDLYKEHVQKLLDEGKAYKCYCTPEEVDEMRKKAMAEGGKPKYDGRCRERTDPPNLPYTIRFKAPLEGSTSFDDICRGTITTPNDQLDDLIIARSDGTPTYNFVVVVDDVTMKITHVVRGDDHINNTPRQVLLYQALGYDVPKFAHLPMIFGPDKKKLSKRHGAASVMEYKDMGYLPGALVNYLARLGWASGDQEIFTTQELFEKFDLDAVGNSPSVFDFEKLAWVNSQHMMKCSNEDLIGMVEPFMSKLGLRMDDRAYAAQVMEVEKPRATTLTELADVSAFFFKDEITIDEKAREKWLGDEGLGVIKSLCTKLDTLDTFNEETLAPIFSSLVEETGLKMKKIAQPVRVALTGNTASPGIFDVLGILGKGRVLARLDEAISKGPFNV